MFDGLVDYLKNLKDTLLCRPPIGLKRKRSNENPRDEDCEPVLPKLSKPDIVSDVHTAYEDSSHLNSTPVPEMAAHIPNGNKENVDDDEISVVCEIPSRRIRTPTKVTQRKKKEQQSSLVTALDRVDQKLQESLSPEKNRIQPKRALEFSPVVQSSGNRLSDLVTHHDPKLSMSLFYGGNTSELSSFRFKQPAIRDVTSATVAAPRRFFKERDKADEDARAKYFTGSVHKKYSLATSLKRPLTLLDKMAVAAGLRKNNPVRMVDKMRYKDLLEKFASPASKGGVIDRPRNGVTVDIMSPFTTFNEKRSILSKSPATRKKVEVIDLAAESTSALTPFITRKKSPSQAPEFVDISGEDEAALVPFPTRRKNSLADQFEPLEYLSESWIDTLEKSIVSYKEEFSAREEELQSQLAFSQEEREKFDEEVSSQLRRRMRISTILLPEPEVEEILVLPPMTPEMESAVDRVLSAGHMEHVIVEAYNQPIKKKDICTLVGVRWLNDEVINFYLNMIVERSQNSKEHCRVFAFNTFFYPKIMKEGHASVKRWTRKVDVFAHDLILVPVHLGVHWCMAIMDISNKTIRYYDSMGSRNDPALRGLLKYLQAESLDKKKTELDASSWKLENLQDIPQQLNGSDCGMFACKFAEYESRRAPITFTQEDMPYFRRRMIYEIVTKNLISP